MATNTKGVGGQEIFESGIPAGFAADCPICGKRNEARYGEDDLLIWNPNPESGVWCEHATGCYEGSRTIPVYFLFA